MSAARIDGTISLGHVLTIVALVITIYGSTADLRERIAGIEAKIDPIWRQFTGQQK